MYDTAINSAAQAICHLFLHCCYKDGQFTTDEVDVVSARFVALDMQKDLNFREEVLAYTGYRDAIAADETGYLQFLLRHINPVNELALYSWCMEVCLGDGHLAAGEEHLLHRLGSVLGIDETARAVINQLMVQRKAVELEHLF